MPPYGSWLTLIELHHGAMHRITLNGYDDPSHKGLRKRISRYLTWRAHRVGSTGSRLDRYRSIKLDGAGSSGSLSVRSSARCEGIDTKPCNIRARESRRPPPLICRGDIRGV